MSHPDQADDPRPPSPPAVSRRTVIPLTQLGGLLLVGLAPVLAVFGVFGPTSAEVEREEAGVRVHVTYPERLRHRQAHAVEVQVRNRSGAPLEGVRVHFEPGYLSRFARPSFMPYAVEPYEVDLGALAPGEEKHAVVDLEGGRAGRHAGHVRVEAGGLPPISLPLRTFVFP
jgi:hypothetical protein